MSEYNNTKQPHITVGGGLAVVALLAFTIGWVILWVHNIDTETFDADAWDGIILGFIIVSPAMWAGRHVSRIIEHGTPPNKPNERDKP